MVESEKGKAKLMVEFEKGKAKLMVSDDMVKYVLAKYGKNWNVEDEITDVILEDLWIKYGKDDKGKGKVDDLQNIVERLEGDLARAKQVEHDNGKAKQAEHDFDDVDLVDALDQVIQVSSDEGFSGDEDVVCFNDVKYPPTAAEIRMFKETPITSRGPRRQLASTFTRSRALIASTTSRASRRQLASTSTRSKALIASTSSAQAASTSALKVYKIIAMTGCVLALFASNAHNAPPPFVPQKRKSKP
ncbi:hypothetical protein Tco_0890920 [Tanacetum coccineum]|uniref:Uncharacterized protein n=1 Tax=Tanacetum coccineum TaxID=301880 RepID=A0ABQ5C4P2_9ASTR